MKHSRPEQMFYLQEQRFSYAWLHDTLTQGSFLQKYAEADRNSYRDSSLTVVQLPVPPDSLSGCLQLPY